MSSTLQDIEPVAPKQGSAYKEIGETGTIIFNGIISQADYNTDLTGWSRIDQYDEMYKGDATVRAAYQAVTLPIRSANWYIKPASETDGTDEVADFIDQQLFKGPTSWSSRLSQFLRYLRYGSYVFEKVYEPLPDGRIGWKKFAPRLPKTIYRWEMSDGKPGIQQMVQTGGFHDIPAWKLLLLVNDQEGENYEGESIFRSAYSHWYMKKSYYMIDALATERQGLGIIKAELGNMPPDERNKLEELLRNIRANEESHLMVPMGVTVDFMDMKAHSIKDPLEMIKHHDRQITKSVLAQFLELGSTDSGSRALSNDHSQLFYLSLQSIAKYIQEMMNREIKLLVDLNFSVTEYPTLEVTDIAMADAEKLANALKDLSDAKLILPTDDTKKHIHKQFGLPELEDQDIADYETKQREAMEHEAEINRPPEAQIVKQPAKKPLHASEHLLDDVLKLKEDIDHALDLAEHPSTD